MSNQWYRTLPFRREGRLGFVVGIYNDATREGDGIAQVYGHTAEKTNALARLVQSIPRQEATIRALRTAAKRVSDDAAIHQAGNPDDLPAISRATLKQVRSANAKADRRAS